MTTYKQIYIIFVFPCPLLQVLYIFWMVSLYLSPFWMLKISLNDDVLCCAEAFQFHKAPFIVDFRPYVIGVQFRKPFPVSMSSNLYPTFSIRFSIFGLMLESLIHWSWVSCNMITFKEHNKIIIKTWNFLSFFFSSLKVSQNEMTVSQMRHMPVNTASLRWFLSQDFF